MNWLKQNWAWIGGGLLSILLMFGVALGGNTPEQNTLELSAKKPLIELIEGKSGEKRDSIVADAWVAVGKKAKKNVKDGLEIEIVGFEKLPKGVAVFARAWQDGEQLGFGPDGTVDIERFQFFGGLPFMVPDGTKSEKVRTNPDGTEVTHLIDNLKEDVEATIYDQLAHTIGVKKEKFTDDKIVVGKVGHTTSTFYTDVDSGYDDGRVLRDLSGTWSQLRDGAGTGAYTQNYVYLSDGAGNWANLFRFGMVFPTATLPDTDTISSAVLSIMPDAKLADAHSISVSIDSFAPADDSAFVASDYGNFGNTRQSDTDIAYASLTEETYSNWTLNATGIANINKTESSRFGCRITDDLTNTEPTMAGTSAVEFYASSYAGTNKPKLVVEHSAVVTFIPQITIY